MIKIQHPSTAQVTFVTKGAYAQVYAPQGWRLATVPKVAEEPKPTKVDPPVKVEKPVKKQAKPRKPAKTKAQVIEELLKDE